MEKLDLDITELTEAEKLAIWKVLKRDEDLRKRDEQRINRLKSELQWLRRRGAIQVGSDPMNSCSRCRCELGKIINRGAPCSICRGRICKSCRHYIKDGLQWICIVCHKQLEIEAATGEWMNEFIRRASKRKDKKNFVPPSDIVKELIVRNQPEGGHEQEKEGSKSGSVNLRVRPSSKSMDYHPRQRSIRQNTSTTQVITSSNDINTITSEERSLEKSSPSSRHVSLNDQAVLSSSPKSSEVPVPAPRTCKRSVSEVAAEVLDEVDSSSVVDSSVSTPPGTVAVANRNSTGSSRQKRQAPQPPGASSPILRVQSQQRQPPPPPPPYRSQNSVSGERSDSGISQDNQPSPKSSSRSGGSAHSSSSGALGVGSKGEQASKSSQNESASITGDSVSSDVESEVESTSGVIFRKVALRRKKKPSPKQRPATVKEDK